MTTTATTMMIALAIRKLCQLSRSWVRERGTGKVEVELSFRHNSKNERLIEHEIMRVKNVLSSFRNRIEQEVPELYVKFLVKVFLSKRRFFPLCWVHC